MSYVYAGYIVTAVVLGVYALSILRAARRLGSK